MVRDPLLIDNQGRRIPEEWRRNYRHRSIDRLPDDLIVAFDRIHTLQKEKDEIQKELIETKRKLDRANLKIWIMSLIVSPIATKVLTVIWIAIFPVTK